MTGLTRLQVERLLRGIDPKHVENKRGLSYISQHQARAELTRIFGFGNWDTQVEEMTLLYEKMIERGDPQYPRSGDGKPYWVTCYRAGVRLNIRDYWGNPVASFVEYHAEENAPLPNRGEAHAMATTSVESYAFRRAAIGLGDRLGLGLYEKGLQVPLIMGTLQLDDPDSPQFRAPQEPAGAPVTVGTPDDTTQTVRSSDAGAQPATAGGLGRLQQAIKHTGANPATGEVE